VEPLCNPLETLNRKGKIMKTNLNLLAAGIFLAAQGIGFGQSTVQFSASTYTVVETAGFVLLTVQRTGDTTTAVSVDFATTNGTATAGLDYTANNGTLNFAPGETNQIIAVPILNDGLPEPSAYESFTVTLSNPSNAVLGTRLACSARITDNDKALTLEFANYWAREAEGAVWIGVVRGDDGDFPISVDIATSDLTATNGLDFTGVTNTLSFAAGEKVKLFPVLILNDGQKESSETLRVTLNNPVNQVLGAQKTATIIILDNDPGVQFTQNQLWVHENEAIIQLTVARGNGGLLGAFTVDYATTNITAIAGQDYVETRGTLEFAPGEMARSFTVTVFDDGVAEPDEQFKVLLSNPTGGMALDVATNVTASVALCDLTEMKPHRFDSIQVTPEGVVTLTLGGGYTPGVGLVNRFEPDFDIYPLEVSTNLVDWVPLRWLVRTNASTNAQTFVDSQVGGSTQRYYRTPSRTFVAPQRPPTGPYAVGFTDRTLTDDTRRNRYRMSTNSSFPITIWYPAERVAGQWPGIYEREPFTRDVRYGAWTGYVDRAPYWCCYSTSNSPFATGLNGVPIILWSHGHPDLRFDGEEWAEHLASQGYVVVGIDHADTSFVVYPDGAYLYTFPSDLVGRGGSPERVLDRIRDFVVALDTLAQWNVDDDLFAGHLAVQNVAAIGWSYGGLTAGEFCRSDSRCKAAISLDGASWQNAPLLVANGLQKPSLTMGSPSNGNQTLFSNATTNAYWFQIQNTEHLSFGTWYWLVTSTSLPNRRETARTITDWTLWFLNKNLKGSADPMPQTAGYPQIINFQQK
jgi:hypothetical protein